MKISLYFILYIIYSVFGWIIEVIDTLYSEKKLVNRGFLIGPYCPIYGEGALLCIFLLSKYKSSVLVLFILSIAICAISEYSCSFILEKLFNTRWWDYSHKKFNINGRICSETMIPFGIACTLLIYIINPFITSLLLKIPSHILNIIAIVLAVIFVVDFVISLIIIIRFKKISDGAKKDSTEKVTAYVRKSILKTGKNLYIRLISAFPTFKIKR